MNAVLGKKFTEFCISFYKLFTMLILKRDLISLEFRVSSVNIFLHLGFISTESFFFSMFTSFLADLFNCHRLSPNTSRYFDLRINVTHS